MPQNDTTPRLLHIEKSGPDFSPAAPIVDQLLQSLQAQAVKVVGETLNALQRCCLLDVCATWPKLLKVVGVRSQGQRLHPPRHRSSVWQWTEMQEAVQLALCYDATSLHWQEADARLRGYAYVAALSSESRMAEYAVECEPSHLETIKANLEVYRAFAEGRL